jgi:hypothetical protein
MYAEVFHVVFLRFSYQISVIISQFFRAWNMPHPSHSLESISTDIIFMNVSEYN